MNRIAITVLCIVALGSAASSSAFASKSETLAKPEELTLRLQKAVGTGQQLAPKLLDLRILISAGQGTAGKIDIAATQAAGQSVLASAKVLKADLESAAAVLLEVDKNEEQGKDRDLLNSVIMIYYSIQGELQRDLTAVSATGQQPGYGPSDVTDLDLTLPAVAARSLQISRGEQASAQGLENYNSEIQIRDVPGGKKRISLQVPEMHRYDIKGFMALPDVSKVKNYVYFNALKILLAEHASLLGYLYSDQKDKEASPSGLDTSLVALRADSIDRVAEGLLRKSITASDFAPLYDAVVKSRDAKKFNGVLIRGFNALVNQGFGGYVNLEKYQQVGSPENLAATFLQSLEPQYFKKFVQEALLKDPLRLNSASVDEMKKIVQGAVAAAEMNLLTALLDKYVFDIDDFRNPKPNGPSLQEGGLLFSFLSAMASEGVPPNVVSDELVTSIQSLRKDSDTTISILRYKLANVVIRASQALEKLDETLQQIVTPYAYKHKHETNQFSFPEDFSFRQVPMSLIPQHPDIGGVLGALHSSETLPTWVLQALQTLASSKNSDGTDHSEASQQLFYNVFKTAPALILNLATDIDSVTTAGENPKFAKPFLTTIFDDVPTFIQNWDPTGLDRIQGTSVLKDLQDLRADAIRTSPYKMASFSGRIQILLKTAKGESFNVLKHYNDMNTAADVIKSSALRRLISDSFESGLGEDGVTATGGLMGSKRNGIDVLKAEALKGKTFIETRQYFKPDVGALEKILGVGDKTSPYLRLEELFGSGEERDTYLRELLTDAQLFKSYLDFLRSEVYERLPLMGMAVRLPSWAVQHLNDPSKARPLSLAQLIPVLRTSVDEMGPDASKALIDDGHDSVISKEMFDPTFVQKEVKTAVSWSNLLVSAANRALPTTTFTEKLGDSLTYSKLVYKAKCWVSSAKCVEFEDEGLIQDAFWPKELRIRDLLPAVIDSTGSADQKALNVFVSALLDPYLRVTYEGNAAAMANLLDPKQDHSKALAQSEAYSQFTQEVGDDAGRLAADYSRRIDEWKEDLNDLKEVTSFAQRFANEKLFWATQLLPELPPIAHMAGFQIMFLSSLADLGADGLLYGNAWDNYLLMQPFGKSGALGSGLVSRAQLEGLRNEMNSRGAGLFERLPNDIPFYLGGVQGWFEIAAHVSAYDKHRLDLGLGIENHDEYFNDVIRLKTAFFRAGLYLDSENFTDLEGKYREVVSRNFSERKYVLAREELNGWVNAMKLKKAFQKKYPKVVATLFSPDGRPGKRVKKLFDEYGPEGVRAAPGASAKKNSPKSQSSGSLYTMALAELGLKSGATQADVKKAYKDYMSENHSDHFARNFREKNGRDPNPDEVAKNLQDNKNKNAAYVLLSQHWLNSGSRSSEPTGPKLLNP